MKKQRGHTNATRFLISKSVGAFKPDTWLEEGDRLRATAKLTRSLFQSRRKRFNTSISRLSAKGTDRARLWNELEGLPRASWLLMGYAVEMYLKSGLAKAYAGCSESMFMRDVQYRFSHKLCRLAREVEFQYTQGEKRLLSELEDTLLAGRYPPYAEDREHYAAKVNSRTYKEWNDEKFRAIKKLATRIREHVTKIDSDNRNTALKMKVMVDSDGYIAFRTGGHLTTRITYRLSSEQKRAGQTEPQDMLNLLESGEKLYPITRDWRNAKLFEDVEGIEGKAKTIRRTMSD